MDTVDPALLHCYYGATGLNSGDIDDRGSPGSDEDGESQRDITEIIADSQLHNIRHKTAEVARNSSPFEDVNDHHAFILALGATLNSLETNPAGFHLGEEYEMAKSYKTGRSTKLLEIPLPYDIWFPCIVVWCKALDLLKHLPLSKAMASLNI